MVICEHAQTEETSGRLNQSNGEDQRERLGRLQSSSRINGIEQIRPDQADSSKKDSFGATDKHRDAYFGKILERLKFIETRYLSHLKTLQTRLESQLDESKGEEESFKTAIQELEQEIYDLVSSQETIESPEKNSL